MEASTGPRGKVDEKKGLTVTQRTWTNERPHPPDLAKYGSYYLSDSEYYASVNVLSNMSVGIGYYTESEEERAKKIVDEMAAEVGLDQILLKAVKYMLIYGYCPVERYFIRGPPKGKIKLKILPPKTMFKLETVKGKLLGYVQKVNNVEVAKFKPKEIVWLQNGVGDYGTSIAAPILNLLDASKQFHEDFPKIIHRYGNPKTVWETDGDEGPLKTAATSCGVDEDIFIGNVREGEIRFKTLEMDPRGRFIEYIEEINESKCEALQAPILRYLRNATEASATKMLEVVDRRIEGIQRYIKRVVEREIFEPTLLLHGVSEVPTLMWGVPQTGVEEIEIDNFLTMGAEIGYITRKQYLDILRQKGLKIEDDDEEPVTPPIKKDDEEPEDDEES